MRGMHINLDVWFSSSGDGGLRLPVRLQCKRPAAVINRQNSLPCIFWRNDRIAVKYDICTPGPDRTLKERPETYTGGASGWRLVLHVCPSWMAESGLKRRLPKGLLPLRETGHGFGCYLGNGNRGTCTTDRRPKPALRSIISQQIGPPTVNLVKAAHVHPWLVLPEVIGKL